jgi:hypothetical protein
LDGGIKGRFPTVAKSSLLALARPPQVVLWHKEVLRPEGRMPTRWTIQTLTFGKKLWLFQMPLTMDVVLGGLSSSHWLSFADSPLPEVYTAIFCQW